MSHRDESEPQGHVDVELAADVFRSLMDQSVSGMMITQGTPPSFVSVNRAFSEMVGFAIAELLAMSVEQVVALIHPEDTEAVLSIYGTVVDGAKDRAVTAFRFRRRDGEWRWLKAAGSVVRFGGQPAVMSLCTDITERRQAEQALRDSERQYRLLAENASDIIWTMDLELNATYISPSEARLRGYPMAEVRKHRFDQRLSPESFERATTGMDAAMKAEAAGHKAFPVTGEMEIMCADGSTLPTETTVSLLRDGEGRPTGYLGVTRDISQRKQVEAERLALERQVQRSQKLDSLGLLVGGVAHDFNNLLHGLVTNMAVVRQELSEGSPALSRLDDMDIATRQAADLCRQMLAYAGKGRVNAEPVDLNEVVSEMAGLLAATLPGKGRLESFLDAELPTLMADATQLRQVAMNLVTNGAEALGPDGGVVSLTTGRQRCEPEHLREAVLGDGASPGMFVFIEVKDDGEGMDTETVAQMFEPFYSTKFAGRGLGLAAVLGIVRAHRGAVIVDSEPGRGSRIRVMLPLVARVAHPEVADDLPVEEMDGAGRLLLVVDDDRLSREGLQDRSVSS